MPETMHLTSEGWVTDSWLRERADAGLDLFDEMADGVILVNPHPRSRHQLFGTDLLMVLQPLAQRLGWVALYETTMYASGDEERNYRTPDLVVVRPEHIVDLGIAGGAELAVEIRSPSDRSYEKFDFYFREGVRHLLIVDPWTRSIELFRRGVEGFEPVGPDHDGWVSVDALGLLLRTEAATSAQPSVPPVPPGITPGTMHARADGIDTTF